MDRAVHCNRTVWNGWSRSTVAGWSRSTVAGWSCSMVAGRSHSTVARQSRSTVAIPVPLTLCSTNQTDGRWDGHHPSNTIQSTAINGIKQH